LSKEEPPPIIIGRSVNINEQMFKIVATLRHEKKVLKQELELLKDKLTRCTCSIGVTNDSPNRNDQIPA
jgi:hypothetical protein